MLFIATICVYIATVNIHIVPFISTDAGHWCKRPPHCKVSQADWRNTAIPLDASGRPSRCSMYETPERPDNEMTVLCTDWEFEERWPRESAVSMWNMVCSRHSPIAVMIVVQNFGSASCVSAAGYFADRIGRKSVVLPLLLVLLLSTVILCVSTAYPVLVAALFFAAGSNAVDMTVACLILFEVSSHAHRPLLNILTGTFGEFYSDLAMAVLERAGLDWQFKLALFLLPALLVLPAFCFVDESPRWLVAKSKLPEAKTVMLAAAEVNHFPLSNTVRLLERLKADIDAPFGELTSNDAAMLAAPVIVSEVLLVVTKFLYVVAAIMVPCYSLELFPTAVRGLTACSGFGCGVFGATSAAAVARLLNRQGRYEVEFPLQALLLSGSLLALCNILHTTTVECAKKTVSPNTETTKQDV
nr:solute carrier family 22 member 4-like [Dermacentor andersoni]